MYALNVVEHQTSRAEPVTFHGFGDTHRRWQTRLNKLKHANPTRVGEELRLPEQQEQGEIHQ